MEVGIIKNMTYYNRTNACDICEINFDEAAGRPYREYNKEGNWTGKWLCQGCYSKERYKNGNTNSNILKLVSDRRTRNQDPNSTNAKGDLFQELTCIWRSTVSTIHVEDLNKKNDNYTRGTPIDHSRDSELGVIQTQGRLYSTIYQRWNFGNLEVEWSKKFDNIVCYCANKDGTLIERMYIFPKEEIIGIKSISIVKNPSKGIQWYEEYRVKDEKTLELVNKIWKDITGTKDLSEWK